MKLPIPVSCYRLSLVPFALVALCLVGPAQSLPSALPSASPAEAAEGCTIGVASGRATPDGRPLLWKNRDTSFQNNRIVRYDDARLIYLALVTAGFDKLAWAGANERGFCLLNAYSPDLGGKSKKGPGNGTLLKRALGACASVAEFEDLLRATNKTGRRTLGSFAVIDASGAAAMFEVSNLDFVRFDAADPKVAPEGYIVRSNFACTRDDAATREKSITRFDRGQSLSFEAVKKADLTPAYLLRHFCRDLADPSGKPYAIGGDAAPSEFVTNRCINRSSSVAAVVFHGVLVDESADLTTFWAILGEPIFSIAVPCWVAAGDVAMSMRGAKRSPLCDLAKEIRRRCYRNLPTAEKKKTKPSLRTRNLPAIWRQTRPVEAEIVSEVEAALTEWRQAKPGAKQMYALHASVASRALQTLEAVVGSLKEIEQPALTGHR